jgi:hypothetical protein
MAGTTSIKRNLIAKSNTTIVAVTSGACFVVVFCAVASVSLLNQLSYQNRIIGADKTALKQLKDDIVATKSLESSYNAFTGTPTNIIGGNPSGTGSQDGSNVKIVLDALPSKYDYPALATSLENILINQTVKIQSITGVDDAANQSNNQTSPSPIPQPMPFQIIVQGDYGSIQNVVKALERSIRPFQVQSMELSGDQNQLVLTVNAQTYYQPAKNLNIKTKVIQ